MLLLCVLAPGVQADVVGDALRARDARVVVVLVDGLVESMVLGNDPDGTALMPSTRIWSEQATRYSDVLASETNALLARELLRSEAADFSSEESGWVRVDRPARVDPVAAVREFEGNAGRRVFVLDLDWLEPKLRPDPEVLARLDPAPWEAGTSAIDIEAARSTRQRRSERLADLESRANLANDARTRDLAWVVSAAHASIDAALAEILDVATSSGAIVLLTATSSTGLGQREAVGPGRGAALDVAKVPVFLRVPGGTPGVDSAPRQWIQLDPDWFDSGLEEERFTWAVPAFGTPEAKSVCEVRWTTSEFTLLDTSAPRQPPRLFDRQLDPGEWYDRAVENPALADSLRGALRDRLYGPEPVLVFQAGDEPVDLELSSTAPIEVSTGNPSVHLQPGQTVRVRMPHGAENLNLGAFQSLSVGGDSFLLADLVVHSTAWRALAKGPVEGPDLKVWTE
jgi:hypothetical protein